MKHTQNHVKRGRALYKLVSLISHFEKILTKQPMTIVIDVRNGL